MRGQCWMPCDMDSGWWKFRILNFNVFFQIFEFSNVFLFFRIFEFLNFRVVFQFFEFSNFWIFVFFFNFLNFRIFEFSNFRGKPCRTHGIGTSQKKMPQYLYTIYASEPLPYIQQSKMWYSWSLAAQDRSLCSFLLFCWCDLLFFQTRIGSIIMNSRPFSVR